MFLICERENENKNLFLLILSGKHTDEDVRNSLLASLLCQVGLYLLALRLFVQPVKAYLE